MPSWLFSYDVARDALIAWSADSREAAGAIDIVPVGSGMDFVVQRANPGQLDGFVIERFSSEPDSTTDLRLLSRVVGGAAADAVAEAARLARQSELSGSWRREVQLDVDPDRGTHRLLFIANVVNAFGWDGQTGDEAMFRESSVEGMLGDVNADVEAVSVAGSLIDRMLSEGTSGKAEGAVRRAGAASRGPVHGVNLIPSEHQGPCADVLVALCFDGDNFERRLDEAVKHAGIHCRGTSLVLFATSKWDPKKWSALEPDVRAVRAQFVVLLVGPEGIPIRIR